MGCGLSCLDKNQYLHLDYPAGKGIKQGPGVKWYCCARSQKLDKLTLTETQYAVIKHLDAEDGVEEGNGKDVFEIVEGPCLLEITDPYAEVGKKRDKVNLTKDQYVVVKDAKTGELRVEEGPILFTPTAYEQVGDAQDKIQLSDTQYIVVTDKETGQKATKIGPRLYTPGPYKKVSHVKDMIVLSNTDYVYVTHTEEGKIEIIAGPQTFAPKPYDKLSDILKKIVLKKDQYIKIVDNDTGIVRVEQGPATIMLQPYEKTVGDMKQAYEVNQHSAVYVFNHDDGSYELIQMNDQPFMFFPSPTQDVVDTRERIRLEQHEVMVIVDKDGHYTFMKGSDNSGSFFIPPYCHALEQEWSTDLQKSHEETTIVSRFDLRPSYMDFEFLIRTKDNVEIIIDLNFYWQIVDIEKMVSITSDAPQDICKHAMSQILSESSRKDMKDFMESFNEIVQGAISKGDKFYSDRGVVIHKVEITGRKCKDPSTEKIFRDIIEEKTNRIKNLEKQEGENEVRLRELEGEIEAEKLKGQKLQVTKSFAREEATNDGQADADRIANFIENLPADLTKEEKMQVYYDMQNTERVKNVTHAGSTLYVTPQEMDFKITNHNFYNKSGGGNGVVNPNPEDPIIVPVDE